MIIGLLQVQIDNIVSMNDGVPPDELPSSGLDLYLKTLQFLYYNIYILYLVLILIVQDKDYCSMLIAERRAYVYGYTNGGPGNCDNNASRPESTKPNKGVPLSWWNLAIPLCAIICFIVINFMITGDDGSGTQGSYDKFININSITGDDKALASIVVVVAILLLAMYPFYTLQIYQNGKLMLPSPSTFKKASTSKEWNDFDDEDIDCPKQLITTNQFLVSFTVGMRGIISTFIIFAFAWSLAKVTVHVGTPRLFIMLIPSSSKVENLPTVLYIISALCALATGSAPCK